MNHLNLSFAACGFLGIYHLGAASALLKHGQKMLKTVRIFAGASAGSLVAAVMLTAPHKIKESKDFIFQFSEDVRKQTFGALTPRYDFLKYLREGIETILPANAHDAAQNRLYISVTNTKSWENSLVSSFASREELVEVLLASCFVPVYAGSNAVEYKGELSAANFQRISHALFPPNQAKMEFVFQDGFEDAVNFLHSENWGRRRHRQDDFLDKQNSVIKGFYGLCK
ncbi:patatin-like phospholipase domain-containing protein 4 isoform X4 [Rana temporaria]|uniref:patatin-like phospholipase domain-containing protein 4 isoform X4 n=1 Tax=Rana temporaria TaxID=8407 RepID=UPI001AADD5F4|nr:patatin-like phospholipase domain-containing protein 4 isoform X4 [Rana temporaria]